MDKVCYTFFCPCFCFPICFFCSQRPIAHTTSLEFNPRFHNIPLDSSNKKRCKAVREVFIKPASFKVEALWQWGPISMQWFYYCINDSLFSILMLCITRIRHDFWGPFAWVASRPRSHWPIYILPFLQVGLRVRCLEKRPHFRMPPWRGKWVCVKRPELLIRAQGPRRRLNSLWTSEKSWNR